MRNTFFRCVIAPIIFWLISTALLALFLPRQVGGLAVSYALLLLTLLLTWWVIAFARWLRSKGVWETIAYLLSNLILGLMPIGIGGAIGFAVGLIHNTLATLIFLFCCVLGIGWLLTSLWRRLREWRHKQYRSIFWRPLQSNAWIWRIWQQSPVLRPLDTAVGAETKRSTITDTTPKANPLFRRIPVPSETPSAITEAIPIPPRSQAPSDAQPVAPSSRATKRTREAEPSPVSITVTLDRSQESFVAQARRLVARTEAQAEPVTFARYSPTYADMSPEQQRWYFYWRTSVRSGRLLPTDLSYLFVYVYECINLVGFDTPQAAFDWLVSFWQHYRALQPKLDQYLLDWLADFLVVHRLPTLPLAWYGQAVTNKIISGDLDFLIEGWLHTGGDCTLLPSPLLYQLAGYSPTSSKFYEAHHRQHNLDAVYLKGVQAVDTYLRQSTGIPLFIQYTPSTRRTIQRPPFVSAYHEYGQTPILIGQVRPWQAQEPLTTRLKAILKQTENVLREQLQFKTKLRGIDLPPAWVTAIEQALRTPTPKRTVAIDFASVAALKRDSEEIRQRLSVEDESLSVPIRTPFDIEQLSQPQQSALNATQNDQRPAPTNPLEQTEKNSISYIERPEGTPVGLLTELTEIAAVMGEPSSAEAQLLASLRNHDWQAPPTNLNGEKQGRFLNVLLDQINERAVTHLGDALVFDEGGLWVVAEDYRDEIAYILDHPAYAVVGIAENVAPSTVAVAPPNVLIVNGNAPFNRTEADRKQELPPEWLQLNIHLQPQHWAVLEILLQGKNVNSQIDSIARQVHTTANQLLDQINEFALDSIGDILIHIQDRTPLLEDEHLVLLQQICDLHNHSTPVAS